ncbi:FXYD domain-containing ion transport regulator 5 isoform X3 [Chlorocebus sabaeus]|uniref:FXYD domain-containing ion transport regulator 5 isoform X3 n=2 Tax=Chlorocebus sabaeus TaxID=60711 RepID=UPI0018B099E6|nr:FXYD domain-containing ion transport regulator 5 isoform X3 [Chlorocebus sabaeus]
MTEPVWVPARSRSPGHTLRLDAAATAASLSPLGCRLRTPSSNMSPFGRLCLLTIVGLILPTRGQTLKYTTSISSADPTIMDIQVPTPAPDAVYTELQATPPTPTWPADETPQPQTQTQTQRPTGIDGPVVTDPETHKSTKTAHPTEDTTTLSERPSPSTDGQTDPQTLKPSGFHEDDPFFYDEHTLRKRGLLVAAVLFITGIIILTSENWGWVGRAPRPGWGL